jgi:xanthine dehydrogenase small subunit
MLMAMSVRFVLNGSPLELVDVDPQLSLLSWLRSTGRTGSKEGCAEGECGACAVALLTLDPDQTPRYRAINSCLVPLAAVHGQALWTVEGVAAPDGTLHPVQAALVAEGGSQCGYCTPGFVISMFCEYYQPGRAAPDAEAISGNLCRCTGYRPILDALRSLPEPCPNDARLPVLQARPAPPQVFTHVGQGRRFVRPASLSEVFEARARDPDAVLIAGGSDLMVEANQRQRRFSTLIALDALPALRECQRGENELSLGAALTLSEIEHALRGALDLPLLRELLPLFASPLIRNRATLGGNLVTASPIGDAAPALLALDAALTVVGPRGERRIPLAAFFVAYRQTALLSDELVKSVHIPLPAPRFQRFYKVSKRVLDDISSVAAGCALDLDAAGTVTCLRLGFGGVAATPQRAQAAERAALGQAWDAHTLERMLSALESFGTPMSDHRASAAYRRAMIESLTRKFFADVQASRGTP